MIAGELQNLYKNELVSYEEAISKIKSGDNVVFGHGCGEPLMLLHFLIKNKEKYKNIELYHMIPMSRSEYTVKGVEKYIHYNSLFVGRYTREAVNSGRSDYIPCFFHEIPRLFKEKYIPVDVALIQVGEPDDHGFCSFGVSNDYIKAAAECAKVVIAEVNKNMPRVLGDCFIHISDIDYIVEDTQPIVEMKPPQIGEVERKIGKYCASLIEDGSTLQLGIGAIPDAVLSFLKDKKDLGVHSEMISDGIVELVESGAITNKKKTLHPGKIVVTFLMGTKKLYNFVNNNAMVESYPVSYVNDPMVIMKNYKMVCINSCVEVDLMGQISAESLGLRQISGVGGQIDFMRGASMAEDGKSIIAIPSTARKGTISRIVPFLSRGSAVTTSRNDVQYVITEYGIAQLRGKSLRKRARELIKIAHPKFRDELINEFENRFNCNYYDEKILLGGRDDGK
ncbi:acetyl-CoA hydrolase/transferase family protein [Clostridium luticellarii]|jgi:4-hydroxybutyrate CoA-transferase|uniref:Succinyl-CoA:coenzyme A transferase n=1 Tax=Clostridium luticellarii TaxID=1691940 RepID=A0A2T0BRC5_9CLOT|nr:acetyl-CoA hydrolase/transferase C-terminal domain-containing protein [Clostridium luticellarii]MCI1944559.1 acetyl-CoA hydrolase/transferase family protein [Clostridium luticellarii]MCI1968058.1 acetyl-CoA hydrolase/transferase family protein [Clostridium luticellarii]MCI1996697.1 acetyl-CoA hydrolase/transferase family protein [Clostridium luticellarii]MCI2040934.1 acetyl-CoA hydrolase/transferase family protein [Clostridium luticellarii]PRR86382.1 Succinyl-CoA:coenzyme A transferase [Clo